MEKDDEVIKRIAKDLFDKITKSDKKSIKDLLHMIETKERFGCAFIYKSKWGDPRLEASVAFYILYKDADLTKTERGAIVLEGHPMGHFMHEGFHLKYINPKSKEEDNDRIRGIVVRPYNELYLLDSLTFKKGNV